MMLLIIIIIVSIRSHFGSRPHGGALQVSQRRSEQSTLAESFRVAFLLSLHLPYLGVPAVAWCGRNSTWAYFAGHRDCLLPGASLGIMDSEGPLQAIFEQLRTISAQVALLPILASQVQKVESRLDEQSHALAGHGQKIDQLMERCSKLEASSSSQCLSFRGSSWTDADFPPLSKKRHINAPQAVETAEARETELLGP